VTWLLDTNAVVALLARQEKVFARVIAAEPGEIVLSAIVWHELAFGAAKSARPERNRAVLGRLALPVFDFTAEDGERTGLVRAELSRAGTPIGPFDTLIAGPALNRGLTLVTRNWREFSRVPGLAIENWQA
jgi:tRNA(fMet)-specific endonuclease VapC